MVNEPTLLAVKLYSLVYMAVEVYPPHSDLVLQTKDSFD